MVIRHPVLILLATALCVVGGQKIALGADEAVTPALEEVEISSEALEFLLVQADESVEALPRPAEMDETDEIPEEILRTEIITGARSPLTGEPLTAAEYAELQAALADPAGTPILNSRIRTLVLLLQIRSGIRPLIPFW